ncbi:MAG: riboflavin synthase [Steroidobacteraceae bacterium]
MFTGIVQCMGSIKSVEPRGGDLRLDIDAACVDAARRQLGDSVAVAGVCLTVAELRPHGFIADVSRETLEHTTIGQWRAGERINLEPALRAGEALGGHMVSGHVDGRADLIERNGDARSQQLRLRAPPGLERYIARKGSVTLDGVSLTVNTVDGRDFGVNLIPHTLEVTTLGKLTPGATLNVEIDLMARYLEQLAIK